MAVDTEPRNAGRRIITQEEAEAIAAKARPDQPAPPPRKRRAKLTRREALVYALAGSAALMTATGAAALTQPDPSVDPLLSEITPEEIRRNVVGGFAYPRFRAGEFGGTFTLARRAGDYTTGDPPDLNATGKFYIVKVDDPVQVEGGAVVAQDGIQAIYQVCTHLGCLIPFQAAENRFICPCHGSTFERDSSYVRGPAARALDQFELEVDADGIITVDTGRRVNGLPV
jgi:cytochrome b6-f complex iron-sulfur subunit